LADISLAIPGTIIDATFGDPQLRHAFLESLGGQHPLCALQCRTPAPLREQRARERAPTNARGSDAAPAVVSRLGASFSDWDELPQGAILTLRSHGDAELLVDQIADWLDTRASAVLTPDARLGKPASGTITRTKE